MRSRNGQKLSPPAGQADRTTVSVARGDGDGGAAREACDFERPAAGVTERGGMLAQELWLRRQARHAASIAADLDDADAVLIPLVLSLARLSAQRDAREQGHSSSLKMGEV